MACVTVRGADQAVLAPIGVRHRVRNTGLGAPAGPGGHRRGRPSGRITWGPKPWEITGHVTQRMCTGRVLIAGVAAHTMPPVGTFGVATGVQDAFNLG